MKLDLKNQTGSITLGSGHSLISGHRPEVITNEMFSGIINKIRECNPEAVLESIERFGLFENSTPNYTTYYPDVKPEELEPKDDEFIRPIFRALSATIVYKGYKPIDFSKPGVLKESMSLLVGQTINADHETALGNAMGTVNSVAWQESYTDKGIKIPAGINAEFKIDGKSNPRIARAIMMKPPAIHSNSVSVRFEWEPSHKLSSNDEFFQKLGSRDDKGNLYRLIVTRIIQYSETSLVSHGADPYAQIISDGKINNPIYADSVYTFSANDDKGIKIKTSHSLDYKTDISLSADGTTPLELNINNNNNEKDKGMKLLEILEGKLSLEKGTLSEENLSESLDNFLTKVKEEALSGKDTEIQTLSGKVTELESEIATLKEGNEEVQLKAEQAEKYVTLIASEREEVKSLYTKLKGDSAKETNLKLIEECTPDVLASLKEDYAIELEQKFPSKCTKCGSTELTKSSSSPEGGEGNSEVLTLSQLKEKAKEKHYKNQNKKS